MCPGIRLWTLLEYASTDGKRLFARISLNQSFHPPFVHGLNECQDRSEGGRGLLFGRERARQADDDLSGLPLSVGNPGKGAKIERIDGILLLPEVRRAGGATTEGVSQDDPLGFAVQPGFRVTLAGTRVLAKQDHDVVVVPSQLSFQHLHMGLG